MKNPKTLPVVGLLIVCLFSSSCERESQKSDKTINGNPSYATVKEIQSLFNSNALTSEELVKQCLRRIEAYDGKGPMLNAMITINENAVEIAKALDLERKEKGIRSPLHGIPIILKDNYDTKDLPTTGGSVILAHSQPVADAFVVKKLRDAGAIILGKSNMSEFALSYGWLGYGSMVGQTKNPHDTLRDPSGSSSGTAAAIAAGYAILGTGTCTAGSIQGPSAVCGVVGIKPTMGLLSRNGIIPASLSFDVPGPIARTVSDAAYMLGIMVGIDPEDTMTNASQGLNFDFQKALDKDALQGKRIGVIRNFNGANADVDSVFEASLQILEDQGATLIEVTLPPPIDNLWPLMGPVVDGDFGPQIEAYLSTLPEGAPHTLQNMIDIAESDEVMNSDTPLNPARIQGFKDALASGGYSSKERTKSLEHDIPAVVLQLKEILNQNELDAFVFPTLPCPASPRHDVTDSTYTCNIDDPYKTCYIASSTGFPEITVPSGYTADGLPVGLSFVGDLFSEESLIGLAYDFEQSTHVFRIPVNTPLISSHE